LARSTCWIRLGMDRASLSQRSGVSNLAGLKLFATTVDVYCCYRCFVRLSVHEFRTQQCSNDEESLTIFGWDIFTAWCANKNQSLRENAIYLCSCSRFFREIYSC